MSRGIAWGADRGGVRRKDRSRKEEARKKKGASFILLYRRKKGLQEESSTEEAKRACIKLRKEGSQLSRTYLQKKTFPPGTAPL